LNEVRALAIAVTRGAFSVDSDRSMAPSDGISGRGDLVWTIQDRRDSTRGFEQG
jgi:hypothetical protein